MRLYEEHIHFLKVKFINLNASENERKGARWILLTYQLQDTLDFGWHLIWGAAFGAMPTLVHEGLQESIPDDLASEV